MQNNWTADGRSGSIVLKKSVGKAEYATIESKRSAILMEAALATGFLNQNCAAASSKSFFQHYRAISVADLRGLRRQVFPRNQPP